MVPTFRALGFPLDETISSLLFFANGGWSDVETLLMILMHHLDFPRKLSELVGLWNQEPLCKSGTLVAGIHAMEFAEAHHRLRRAAEFIATRDGEHDRLSVLLGAWQLLKGLRADDFPAQFRSSFAYLQHEISQLDSREVSEREADFLARKIRELELKWIE